MEAREGGDGMVNRDQIVIMALLAVVAIALLLPGEPSREAPDDATPLPVQPKAVEPVWIAWPAVRSVSDAKNGKVWSDIASHLKPTRGYDNKISDAHEWSHHIHANIRNTWPGKKINAFYVLGDKACVIDEPPTTIPKIAPRIPTALRGPSYQLYLINHDPGWRSCPLYLFDEWSSYTNGAECGREMNFSGWDYELLQSMNFAVYCTCLAMVVAEECRGYDDTQLKAFLMWQTERCFGLASPYERDPGQTKQALEYVAKVRLASEAEEFRLFARRYYGADWCLRVWGF